ncbi:MAG: lysophospholipase [Coriobacteriia bacterium]|nr:lysophospholipase [Coriobacteriia bacterium]
MKETALSYPSADGHSTIRAWIYEPSGASANPNKPFAPLAVIQIVHGVSEYSGRYQALIKFFVEKGYVVCAQDHIGHGQSAASPDELGQMPLKGGAEALIADVQHLRELVCGRYPASVPYVLLGHSMGSFIVRCYLASYGQGVAAAICSGTAQTPAITSFFGHLMARLIAAIKGDGYRSGFLHNLGLGAYSKKIKDRRTEFDWLCSDPAVVDAYMADPLCGARLTAGGYATLTGLTRRMMAVKTLNATPKKLSLLFLSGQNDPVGHMGADPAQAFKDYHRVGVEYVDLKVFSGARHEIFNEPNKRSVYNHIEGWLKLRLGV